MGLFDFILNLTGLLLWVSWRTLGFDPLLKASPATLTGTLRRAEPTSWKRWHVLATLAALLVVRAWLYWKIGPTVNWMPSLRLGAIAILFRSDFFERMLLFSVLGFLLTLAVFYSCLLLLSLVNSRELELDPLQRLMRLHLGPLERWPWAVKLLLPLAAILLVWLLLYPVLAWFELVPQQVSAKHRLAEGFVIGLGSYLLWRFVVVGVLALCLLTTYVYLGNHWFWKFVAATGRNMLLPLRRLPLQLGKLDLRPIFGIGLVLVLSYFAERGLLALYEQLPL
jgi:uncharacterized protein YggT (Ycf19 family)